MEGSSYSSASERSARGGHRTRSFGGAAPQEQLCLWTCQAREDASSFGAALCRSVDLVSGAPCALEELLEQGEQAGKRDAPALTQPASSCAFGLGDSARTHDVTAARELVRIAAAKRGISRMAMALKESGWRSYSILRRSRECARMGHKCPTCFAIARQLLLIDARSSRM